MRSKADLFDADLAQLAAWAKAVSHPARLQILDVLSEADTCICGEVVDQLPLAQASVSRHLKTLCEAGLVQSEADGPRTCYCVDPEGVRAMKAAFGAYFDDLTAGAAFSSLDPSPCCPDASRGDAPDCC